MKTITVQSILEAEKPLGLGYSDAERAVKQCGKEFSRHGGGSGPFKFKLWESNQQVVLEASPDYWQGPPKLKGLVFRPIVDENARVSEMLSGGTDVTIYRRFAPTMPAKSR